MRSISLRGDSSAIAGAAVACANTRQTTAKHAMIEIPSMNAATSAASSMTPSSVNAARIYGISFWRSAGESRETNPFRRMNAFRAACQFPAFMASPQSRAALIACSSSDINSLGGGPHPGLGEVGTGGMAMVSILESGCRKASQPLAAANGTAPR
jgi:hypothetical protein